MTVESLRIRLESLVEGSRDELPRERAVEAVLLELAARLVGEQAPRPWAAPSSALHARLRDSIDEPLVDAARRQCVRDVRMLGPVFEALNHREARHARGQYFTPAPIAAQMAEIVGCHGAETILDPAVGAGVLLASCANGESLVGIDSSPVCAALATAGLAARGAVDARIHIGDFLDGPPAVGPVDAVIANPPYQRHHLLDPAQKRALTARYTDRFGHRISALSSSYVYFLLEAVERVRKGGVVVFITPADYLDARFGESVKRVLRDRVTLDEIVLFDRSELAFDDVLTTSAITVLRKAPPPRHHVVRFTEGEQVNETRGRSLEPADGWSLQFGRRRAEFERLGRGRPRSLSDYLRVRRGIATGANDFFLIDEATRDHWGLPDDVLSPVLASARDLPDGVLTSKHWQGLRDGGRRCWLLDCDRPLDELQGTGLHAYLREGERLGVHRRFNCRSRTPWYRVEPVPAPEIIVTYMQRGATRFVRNDAGCRLMSVFLNGFVIAGDVDELISVLNSEETAGLIRALARTYGGGLAKIEPRALKGLPMPAL